MGAGWRVVSPALPAFLLGAEPASRGGGLPGWSPRQRGGGAWPRRVLFPAAPALTTPAPADRPLRWPSLARTGREHPLTPRPSPIDCLAVPPLGLTREQGPAATERGKGGSRAGGRERSQRGAGLVRTLEEERGPPSLLPAEAGCPWGLTQSDHGWAPQEAPPPGRSGPRWPQLRTRGLQRGWRGTARAHQAPLPCMARSPLASQARGPRVFREHPGWAALRLLGPRSPHRSLSLSLTQLGSAHRGSPCAPGVGGTGF